MSTIPLYIKYVVFKTNDKHFIYHSAHLTLNNENRYCLTYS